MYHSLSRNDSVVCSDVLYVFALAEGAVYSTRLSTRTESPGIDKHLVFIYIAAMLTLSISLRPIIACAMFHKDSSPSPYQVGQTYVHDSHQPGLNNLGQIFIESVSNHRPDPDIRSSFSKSLIYGGFLLCVRLQYPSSSRISYTFLAKVKKARRRILSLRQSLLKEGG